MHILSVGLNHTSAPVPLRERLAFDEDQIRASLSRKFSRQAKTSLAELVIISTCNRVELYTASDQLTYAHLESFLLDGRDVPVDELRPSLYRHEDMEAARHLFDVAAGLDSLVVGEPQILGQIARALELARGQNAAGATLNRLFQAAIRAGKRARTETAIGRNPASVSSLAASLAEKTLGQIKTSSVVVLGAGEMAEWTVEALRKRGVRKIRVVNRTLERAHALADRWGAESATFESLPDALHEADVLISSTGAPHFIVSAQMVANVMRSRPEHPLVLIDIAVPRDIDPDAGNIPHVKLFDIDGLNTQLEDSLARRLEEVPKARQILREELLKFENYWKSLEILPIISGLRQQAEAIRTAELEKTLRRMPDLTRAERGRIEALTQSLVKKLLDSPTRRLRSEAASQGATDYAALARMLFNLSDEHIHSNSTAADSKE